MTELLSNKNPCNDCKVDRQIGNPNRWECECSRCDKPNDWKNECVKKLAEYETAEEEERLVALPCKNWMDIVFGEQELFYGIDMDYTENPIREITVHNEERFTWYDGWKTVVLKGVDENGLDWEFAPEEIGKTVFLTREEAEKALKEMEGKQNE